mmetsp:Transcript_75560/g.233791  ORF Transcript_75560/g.233791 Transcript_75560/m.233791 type:complete len:216 (+) Transcript_75560:386-1033(+)
MKTRNIAGTKLERTTLTMLPLCFCLSLTCAFTHGFRKAVTPRKRCLSNDKTFELAMISSHEMPKRGQQEWIDGWRSHGMSDNIMERASTAMYPMVRCLSRFLFFSDADVDSASPVRNWSKEVITQMSASTACPVVATKCSCSCNVGLGSTMWMPPRCHSFELAHLHQDGPNATRASTTVAHKKRCSVSRWSHKAEVARCSLVQRSICRSEYAKRL